MKDVTTFVCIYKIEYACSVSISSHVGVVGGLS